MDEVQLISLIEELGLSNKEALVYVANLKLGPSPVQRIADQAGIKRVTAYVILESLVGLGLVSQAQKGKKTFFIAEDPNNLRRLIEKREQILVDQKANFEQVLPQLMSLRGLSDDAPNVKFYDSAEGIKGIMKTFLASHRDEATDGIYGVSNLDQLYAFFPEFNAQSSNPERVRQGVPSKFLYTSKEGPILKESDKERNRISRWVPTDKYSISGDFSIVGHHVVMLSLSGSKPFAITIESQQIAKGLTGLFTLAWEAAEQYNK